jgi:hypothetical protein
MRGISTIAVLALAGSLWVAVGCDSETEEPIVWGECGPPQLAEPVPDGVFQALETALEPGGFLESNDLHCEDGQETAFGICYLSGTLRESASSTEPTDDFIEFLQDYSCWIACDGEYTLGAGVGLDDSGWEVGSGSSGGGSVPHGWDDLIGPTEREGCGRALVAVGSWRRFMIATHQDDGPLIYPLGDDLSDWGEEYEGMQFGEVAFTKEEFLDWCQQNDWLSQ